MNGMPMLLRSWWVLAVRGVLALVLGVLVLALPGITLLTLIALFAVYALLAGAVMLVGAVRHRGSADWWLLLALGLVSVVAGILAAMHPALTALVLVIVIGVNALITGIVELAMAIRVRHHLRGAEWALILSGIASLVFGIVVVMLPAAGALALVWMLGIYAVLIGFLNLGLAIRARAAQSARRAGDFGRDGKERRVRERRGMVQPS